jgi:hypothetical protein
VVRISDFENMSEGTVLTLYPSEAKLREDSSMKPITGRFMGFKKIQGATAGEGNDSIILKIEYGEGQAPHTVEPKMWEMGGFEILEQNVKLR